jgi:hypothetical protein
VDFKGSFYLNFLWVLRENVIGIFKKEETGFNGEVKDWKG